MLDGAGGFVGIRAPGLELPTSTGAALVSCTAALIGMVVGTGSGFAGAALVSCYHHKV